MPHPEMNYFSETDLVSIDRPLALSPDSAGQIRLDVFTRRSKDKDDSIVVLFGTASIDLRWCIHNN